MDGTDYPYGIDPNCPEMLKAREDARVHGLGIIYRNRKGELQAIDPVAGAFDMMAANGGELIYIRPEDFATADAVEALSATNSVRAAITNGMMPA